MSTRVTHKKPASRRPGLLSAAHVSSIFTRFAAAAPQPRTELVYEDAYTLLVAVVLSAQATDVSVNKATASLFAAAKTPEAMVALGVEGIKQHIKTIGLYNAKARHVFALSKQLLIEHAGQVPRERAALERLPGVGRKTANVVLNCIWGEPTMAVDTHVFRVARRIGLSNGATPLAVELELLKRIPAAFLHHAHHWLILHGRYTCTARAPKCSGCTIADLCLKRL